MFRALLTLAIILARLTFTTGWTTPMIRQHPKTWLYSSESDTPEDDLLPSLKTELENYLYVRRQAGAENRNTEEIGKVIGGTKGNVILDFISGAPNKELVIEDPSDIFDYSELEKFGFGYLAKPIMKAGGRLAMYKLLEMPLPVLKRKPKPKPVEELVIDKTGDTDRGRYSGIKMGLLDDNAMAEALQQTQSKEKEGLPLRTQIEEEKYVAPYKMKRNVGPSMTPDWTVERVDEELSRQGSAISWARNARSEQLVNDQAESLALDALQQGYSVATALLIAFSFGKATPTFLSSFDMPIRDIQELVDILKAPALGLFVTSTVSCVLCSKQASSKRRSPLLWALKGFFGGPLSLQELQQLPQLLSRAELERIRSNVEPK